MSTLSKTRLKNMIKKYIQDVIHDFELEQVTIERSLRSGMSGCFADLKNYLVVINWINNLNYFPRFSGA